MAIVGQRKVQCPSCERFCPVLMKMKPGDADEHETQPHWKCCWCDEFLCVFCYSEHAHPELNS